MNGDVGTVLQVRLYKRVISEQASRGRALFKRVLSQASVNEEEKVYPPYTQQSWSEWPEART